MMASRSRQLKIVVYGSIYRLLINLTIVLNYNEVRQLLNVPNENINILKTRLCVFDQDNGVFPKSKQLTQI